MLSFLVLFYIVLSRLVLYCLLIFLGTLSPLADGPKEDPMSYARYVYTRPSLLTLCLCLSLSFSLPFSLHLSLCLSLCLSVWLSLFLSCLVSFPLS